MGRMGEYWRRAKGKEPAKKDLPDWILTETLNNILNKQAIFRNSQTPVAPSRLPQGPTYSHCS